MGLFSGILKAAAPIVGGIIGGPAGAAAGSALVGSLGADEAMQFSSAQSADQMAFQERMSNTAHQRETADLIAAGLNPALSALKGNNGASTPTGSQAQHIENSALSGSTAALNNAQLGLLTAQTRSAESQAALNSASAGKVQLESQSLGMENSQRFANLPTETFVKGKELDARQSKAIYDSYKASNDWNSISYLNDLATKHGYRNYDEAIKSQDFRDQLQNFYLTGLSGNEKKAFSDMYSTSYGKHIAPYISSAVGASNGVGNAASTIKYLVK